MQKKLHLEILPEIQLNLLQKLTEQPFIHDFYLAGGTCLALHIGHRRSIDFDFFIPDDFNTSVIVNKLNNIGDYERENEEMNTINGSLNGVRVSFFTYKYPVLDEFDVFNGIRLAGLRDLAAMKLEAIAGRGSKKDFVDLYFLLNLFSMDEIFFFHEAKYGQGISNQYHLMKSLVYFSDAEQEAMPSMLTPLYWEDVKKHITLLARKFKQ